MLPRGPKKCKSLGAIRKKSLLCRKSAILSIRWIFPFSEGWGGSLKKVLILVQRPQHKSTSDPVAAPKNNAFVAIFIEFGDTKNAALFQALNWSQKAEKSELPLSAACAKVPNAFKPFGTIRKKFLLCKSTKKSRYVRSLGKKSHFGAFPEAKNGCCTCSGALKMLPKGPKKCKSLGAIRKKSLLCRKSAILSIRWTFPFSEGWGGSLKKVLILVQRPQHKSTSDPVAAPKNNAFGAIFIEFGDTKMLHFFRA